MSDEKSNPQEIEEFIEGIKKDGSMQEFARVTKVPKRKIPRDVEIRLLQASAPLIGQFRKQLKDNPPQIFSPDSK